MELPFDRDRFILEEWPEALESGEFEQGTGRLRTVTHKTTYCCLGVACALLERRGLLDPWWWDAEGVLPPEARHLLRISSFGRLNASPTLSLVVCNDELEENFHQIAARLRAGQLGELDD